MTDILPQSLMTFLEATPLRNPDIPLLLHSARARSFLKILSSLKIDPEPCDVFVRDSLSYFFIGRPAYKFCECPSSDYWLMPIVFILETPNIFPKRIFPFDSGAFAQGLFGTTHDDFSLDDYLVTSDNLNPVRKIIDVFFGDNDQYLSFKPKAVDQLTMEFNLKSTDFIIKSLAALYAKGTTNDFDDRVGCIEIQYDQPIEINSILKGIVLPEDWILQSTEIEDALQSLGCLVETYPVYPISRSNYYSKIYELSGQICNA